MNFANLSALGVVAGLAGLAALLFVFVLCSALSGKLFRWE